MQQNAPFCVLLKNNFLGGGGGGGAWQTLDPLPLLVSPGLACMDDGVGERQLTFKSA